MIITSLFWKLTKVSTNNLKVDIKGTSSQLKCEKILQLYKSVFINCQEILCHAALEVLRVTTLKCILQKISIQISLCSSRRLIRAENFTVGQFSECLRTTLPRGSVGCLT